MTATTFDTKTRSIFNGGRRLLPEEIKNDI